MDEYIKREDAMKALDEHRLSHTMSMHGDMELLAEYRDGVVGAMNALAFVPTADVVPKSEVDLYRKQVDELEDELAQTYEKLDNAKAEVASEIFEEIERTCVDTFGNFYMGATRGAFAELKKKYIPQEPMT